MGQCAVSIYASPRELVPQAWGRSLDKMPFLILRMINIRCHHGWLKLSAGDGFEDLISRGMVEEIRKEAAMIFTDLARLKAKCCFLLGLGRGHAFSWANQERRGRP